MATQNTDLKEAKKDAIMTPDMYRSMFLRQFTSQCSQSYDKMMAMGFMYTIQKPLRKIYPNDDDYLQRSIAIPSSLTSRLMCFRL